MGNVDSRTCWQPRGPADKQVIDYAEKCFEVHSWCNLLCPRDTPQTVDHVMCKHCTLSASRPATGTSSASTARSARSQHNWSNPEPPACAFGRGVGDSKYSVVSR